MEAKEGLWPKLIMAFRKDSAVPSWISLGISDQIMVSSSEGTSGYVFKQFSPRNSDRLRAMCYWPYRQTGRI